MPTSIPNSRRRRRLWPRVVVALGGVGAIALLIAVRVGGVDEGEPSLQEYPNSLLGSWARAYPKPGASDTITLREDGTATGPATAIGEDGSLEGISEWLVGYWLATAGICFRDTVGTLSCMGWALRGDTLALANGQNTVLIRAAAFSGNAEGDRARFGEVPASPTPPAGNRPQKQGRSARRDGSGRRP